MGTGPRLSLGFKHVCGCSEWRTPGSAAICPPERHGIKSVQAAAGGGHLSVLTWLRKHGGEWDSCTSRQAIINNHLELLRWARLQQPPCPYYHASNDLYRYEIAPRMLVYLSKEPALMHVLHLTGVCVAEKQMVCALLSLRAALPDRTPHELVLTIMRLAFP